MTVLIVWTNSSLIENNLGQFFTNSMIVKQLTFY